MKAAMPLQPLLHVGMFVRTVIVHNQVQSQVRRPLSIQTAQELQELLMPVARHAFPDDLAVQHVQSRKQSCSSVAFVIVGQSGAASSFHGQTGLGSVQGLNLTLLVHAHYQSFVRRV